MDPATISAGASLIGAVGSLFGGGGSKAEWVTPKYGEIRRKAEAAGFNPLTALSMAAGGVGTSTQSTFGQRVADAALGVSDAAASAQDYSLQKTALDQREREIAIKEKAAENLARQSRVSTGIGQRQVAAQTLLGSGQTSRNGVLYGEGGDVSIDLPTGVTNTSEDLIQANPDNPAEAEADLWAWARQGEFFPQGLKLVQKNNFTNPVWWHERIMKSDGLAAYQDHYDSYMSKLGGHTPRNYMSPKPLATPSDYR